MAKKKSAVHFVHAAHAARAHSFGRQADEASKAAFQLQGRANALRDLATFHASLAQATLQSSLIERGLEAAVNKLQAGATIEPADRVKVLSGRKGKPGIVPLADTIFERIDRASVVVNRKMNAGAAHLAKVLMTSRSLHVSGSDPARSMSRRQNGRHPAEDGCTSMGTLI